MISVGVVLGGPERPPVDALLSATMKAVKATRSNEYEFHRKPAVNVVFYVPGSLFDYRDLKKIEPVRFSRKRKLLLVAVPVPRDQVNSGGSVEFVIDALHQANMIAAETFRREGLEPFDFEAAEAVVERVRQTLQH
jgi:hypothetical protein